MTPDDAHTVSSADVRRAVARSTASNAAGQLFTIATAFLLTPFVLGHVGPAAFGLWLVVTAFVGYGGLLDLGISSAIIKLVAEHRARGDMAMAHRVTATAVGVYAAAGAVVVLAAAAVAPFIGDLIGLAGADRETAAWLMLLVALDIGLALPFTGPTAFLRGLQRFDLTNLVAVVRTSVAAVVIVAALSAGGGIVAVAAANVVAAVVAQIVALRLAARVSPGFRPGWRGGDRMLARRVLAFSWSVSVVQLAGRLTNRTDAIVIAAFMPLTSVTPFVLAQRLGEAVFLLANQFLKVLLPVAAGFDPERESGRLRSLLVSGTRLGLALALPAALTVCVFASALLTAWVGGEYAGYGDLVVLLTAAFVVDVVTWPAGSVLVGIGRHRPLAWMAIANGIANVALSIALIGPFGLVGVAVGTLVPNVVEGLLLAVPFAARAVGLRPLALLRSSVLPHLVPSAVVVAALVLVRETLDPRSVLALAAVALGAAVGYAALYLGLVGPTVERTLARDLGRRATAWIPTRRLAP